MSDMVARQKEIALLDLLDRIISKGVVLYGDITLSVADVDLVYLGLKLLLTSVETAEQWKRTMVERQAGGLPPGAEPPLSRLL